MQRKPATLVRSIIIKKRRLDGIGRLRLQLDIYDQGSTCEDVSIEVTDYFANAWDRGYNKASLSRDCVNAAWPFLVESKFKYNTIKLKYKGREFWTVFMVLNDETGIPYGCGEA